MSVLIKICGITSDDSADAAVRAGVDLAGLVFRPGSPRELRPDQGSALANRLRGKVRLAVVLSDPTDIDLDRAVSAIRPDAIQLHGNESPFRVAAIRERFRLEIIKAIGVAEASDLDMVPQYESYADMLLFDTKAPTGASREGGHGAAFDWQILNGRRFTRPWLLAGGLNPDNVERAIRSSHAPGVDVSSGVETSPGQKSSALISQFVAAARAAEFAKEAGA